MKEDKRKWTYILDNIQTAYFRRRISWPKLIYIVLITFIVSLLWISSANRELSLSYIRHKETSFINAGTPSTSSIHPLSSNCFKRRNARDRFSCQAETSLKEFERWLNSQSKTLAQARRRYRKRYGRSAPRWFESWYEYCKANDIKIIDDYDQVELDLKPFREDFVNKTLILKAMEDVGKAEGAYEGNHFISFLKIKDGDIDIKLPWAPVILRGLRKIIDPVQHLLSDLEILVNWGDEPLIRSPDRALIASEDLPPVRHLQTAQSIVGFDSKPCPISGVLALESIERLAFKPRHDPCKPEDLIDLQNRHGKFQHPGREYNVTFPLLSTAKMTQHQDILFPMRGDVYGLLDGRIDKTTWEQKSDSLFWRGSTSGQENTDVNWNMSHRSRFVFDAQMWNKTMSELDALNTRQKNGLKRQLLRSELAKERDLSKEGIEALSRLPLNTFNVSFTKYIFCRQKGCEKIAEKSPKSAYLPESTKWEHKFVFDIDGLGMSERYYALLRSNSVVLKQTEWAEWHDEYLIPWVHFIPVTLSMKELPELMDFLINDEKGREIAKRIAKDSRAWVESAMSVKAQSAFMLRLLNEYADALYGRQS